MAEEKKQAQGNIFSTPLTHNQQILKDHLTVEAEKNKRKGGVMLGAAIVILVAYSIGFLFPQVNIYLELPKQIEKLNEKIEVERVEKSGLEDERDSKKSAYDIETAEEQKRVNKILPVEADRLGITKRLENFATMTDDSTPPFSFNSISFLEAEKKGNVTIHPILTTIETTEDNFQRFLKLIDLSGRLDNEFEIRLMEISDISVNITENPEETSDDELVNFSVRLNAYSRNQE